MAEFKFNIGVQAGSFYNIYNSSSFNFWSPWSNANSATLSNNSTLNVFFGGQNFTFDPDDDTFASGRLKSLDFAGPDEFTIYGIVTKLNLDVSVLNGIENPADMMPFIFAGRDKITGNNGDNGLDGFAGKDTLKALAGDDTLDGGAGVDSLFGGKGSDTFLITLTSGNDVIKDFDATGGGELQDYLQFDAGIDDIIAFRKGDDVIVKVVGGPRITLEDVKLSQFNEEDYAFVT